MLSIYISLKEKRKKKDKKINELTDWSIIYLRLSFNLFYIKIDGKSLSKTKINWKFLDSLKQSVLEKKNWNRRVYISLDN